MSRDAVVHHLRRLGSPGDTSPRRMDTNYAWASRGPVGMGRCHGTRSCTIYDVSPVADIILTWRHESETDGHELREVDGPRGPRDLWATGVVRAVREAHTSQTRYTPIYVLLLLLSATSRVHKQMMTFATRRFRPSEDRYFAESIDAFRMAGIRIHRSKNPQWIIFKTNRKTMRKLYPEVERASLSVTDRATKEVHLFEENWDCIPTHLGSEYTNLDDYRVALISHEIAHTLGHDHVTCACVGCESDVRQQPSRGLHGCIPTPRVVFHDSSPHTERNI